MRAVIVSEFRDVEASGLGDMPKPLPGPDEILVNIKATAVNYVELLAIAGKDQFRQECLSLIERRRQKSGLSANGRFYSPEHQIHVEKALSKSAIN